MDNNQNQAIMGALGYPMALPQSVMPVTNKTTQVQRTQYDANKLQTLLDALGAKTPRKTGTESLASALAQTPDGRSYKGAYGVEVINPWVNGLSALARGFGGVYGDRLASAREAEMQDRENAIKAAQVALDADKQEIVDKVEDTHIKVNDPNAKNMSEFVKNTPQLGMAQSLQGMLDQNAALYSTFDKDFASREDYAKQSGAQAAMSDSLRYGITADKDERQARKTFDTLKKQSVVELRQQMKGQGQISDKETDLLRTMESARDPYEFEIAGKTLLELMQNRVNNNAATYGLQPTQNTGDINELWSLI